MQKKNYTIILVLLFSFYSAQASKVQVVNKDNNSPLSHARFLFPDQVIYSNDDGFILLPDNSKDYKVSAIGYEPQTITKHTNLIKLQPVYQNIEEVTIKMIDFKTILENVNKNYFKIYYSKPSTFEIIYKQKNSEDEKINFLVTAEAKFWSSSNSYNYKKAYQKKYNDFVQLELNRIKYLKISTAKKKNLENMEITNPTGFIGSLFFNYDLEKLIKFINAKGVKSSGRLLNENNGVQNISFSVNTPSGIILTGNYLYNKKANAITYYELNYNQEAIPSYKFIDTDGVEREFKPGNGQTIFEFYEKDGKYIPSLSKTKGNHFIIYENRTCHKKFSREIVYQKFKKSRTSDFKNVIDFKKQMWQNIPNEEAKESLMLLSKEELQFINDKNND